ncbi:hypothetical protein BFG51_02630 [Dietzia alimentaria]|nr:hypothetical protein BFG51_02630 [Dietzia alimentaria]
MPILTGTIDDVTGSPLPDRVPLATLRVTVRAPSRRSSLTEQARLVASVPVPVEVSPTGEISVELEPGPAVMLVEGEGLRDVYELGVTADMTLLTEALQEMSPTRSWVESQMVQLRSQTVTAAGDAQAAKSDAEGAASVAEGHRTHVDAIRELLDEAAQTNVAPYLTDTALSATYGTKAEVQAAADAAASLDADKLDKTEAAATYLERADFVPSLGSDWVAFGDSLTSPEGGAPPGGAWVDYVRFRTDGRFYLLKNSGIPGNNTAQMLARLQADVLAYNPRVVTFMGGTNDITQGVTLATYQSNVTQIVDRLTAAGIAVIILSIPPRDLTDKKLPETVRFNAWLKDFARTRRLHFVDVHSRMVDPATGGFKAGLARDDLLHFSRSGAATVGDAVIEAMSPFMPTGGVYRPAFNNDPNNMVNNGLLLSGTDFTPTGFTYNALPAGVTRGRVDDSSFQGGKAWQVTVTAPAATVTSSFETSVRAEWSPGDRLLFTVRFEIEGTPSLPHNPPDSNFGITFASLFYGAPSGAVQYLARYQSLAGHYGLAHAVTQVPAGTTGPVQVTSNVVMPAGSSGTFRVGEFGCYNLTTMGVLA